MSIEILEILKSKNLFLAHFLSKNRYFSSRWCRRAQILEWIFGFVYFVTYLQSYLQKREGGVWEVWNLVCRAVRSCREKKFKIAFFPDQPFMEQISSKYLYHLYHQTDIWQSFYLQHSTGPQHIHHILSLFWLNCYWFFCKFAGLWACNQLAPKYIEEIESAFQILLSETNEPKENETWSLNFPIDNLLQKKRHSALKPVRISVKFCLVQSWQDRFLP